MFWFDLTVFLASLAGFIYGAAKFFRESTALYLQMITCGVGCMILGRLFQIVMYLNIGGYWPGFHVGYLGTAGMFLFLLGSNYGQIDSLVDDKSPGLRKYRILAIIAPLISFLGFIPIMISPADKGMKISFGIVVLFIALASYYHFKHLLIPDVEQGIVRSLRNHNLIALALCILSISEMIIRANNGTYALIPVCILMCVCILLLMPVVERSAKNWTT